MTRVELDHGQVLYQPGARQSHVYFPNDCMVSLLVVLGRDASLEVGLVGKEGMVGVGAALGHPATPVRALVQRSGSAMKCPAATFAREVKRSPALARAIDRHVYVTMVIAMQIAACNSAHQIGPRLARWLLMVRDRAATHERDLHMTQDLLSLMLGVRRAGVNAAAAALQRRGLIEYSRGRIRILDAAGLRSAACSCYEVIRKLSDAG